MWRNFQTLSLYWLNNANETSLRRWFPKRTNCIRKWDMAAYVRGAIYLCDTIYLRYKNQLNEVAHFRAWRMCFMKIWDLVQIHLILTSSNRGHVGWQVNFCWDLPIVRMNAECSSGILISAFVAGRCYSQEYATCTLMAVGKTRKLAIVQKLKPHCQTRVDLPVWRTKLTVAVGTELIEWDRWGSARARHWVWSDWRTKELILFWRSGDRASW